MLSALKDASVQQPADVLMGTLHGFIRFALAEIYFVEDFLGLALAFGGDLFLKVILVTFLESCEIHLKISTLLMNLNLLLRVLRLSDSLFLMSLTVVLTSPI